MGKRGRPPKERVLTAAHIDVLDRMQNGSTDREIADQIGMAYWPTRELVRETLKLLGARTRAHAVAIGNRDGLICLPPLTDVEATGECCCAGCIGMGPCDDDLGKSDPDDRDSDDDEGPGWEFG